MSGTTPTVPDLPGVALDANGLRRFLDALRELMQTREGRRGNVLDKAVTWREMLGWGLLMPTGLSGPTGRPIYIPPPTDLTPPPAATGLAVSAGYATLFVEWNQPFYTQGGGHAYVEVWAAQYSGSGPLPTFSSAQLVSKEVATIFAFNAGLMKTYHFWIRSVSRAGVPQATPTGGTNGVSASTSLDVKQMLDELTAAAVNPASTYSKIGFRADLFYIAPEADFYQEATPTGTVVGQLWFKPSTGVTKTWDGAAWDSFDTPFPFIVQTQPTTLNGVLIPAGVYMDSAYIYDLTASIARLGDAWIDNAMVANLSAAKITAGSLQVGSYIRSTSYVSGSSGWSINADGTAEFSGVIVRGTLYASAGLIGGAVIDADGIESDNYVTGVSGWRLDNDLGSVEIMDGVFNGTIVAESGSIGGAIIDADGIESDNYVAGSAGWRLDNDTGILYAVDIDLSGAVDVVDTPNIAADAVSGVVSASSTSTDSSVGTWAAVLTCASLTVPAGVKVALMVSVLPIAGVDFSTGDPTMPNLRLVRDSTVLKTWRPGLTAQFHVDSPSAGSYVYALEINDDVLDDFIFDTPSGCKDRTLIAMGFKK